MKQNTDRSYYRNCKILIYLYPRQRAQYCIITFMEMNVCIILRLE